MGVTSGPRWLRADVPLNFPFLHLLAEQTGLVDLEIGGAARWQEPASLNGCMEHRCLPPLTSKSGMCCELYINLCV